MGFMIPQAPAGSGHPLWLSMARTTSWCGKTIAAAVVGASSRRGSLPVVRCLTPPASRSRQLRIPQTEPAIAFDGADYLVVWRDSSGETDICGARVTAEGNVLDPQGSCHLAGGARPEVPRALAFDGANLLVAWDDYRNFDPDIYGVRVSPAGSVLDSAGSVISQAANYQWYPAPGFDGTNFSWSGKMSAVGATTSTARVTPQGAVLDPVAFHLGGN